MRSTSCALGCCVSVPGVSVRLSTRPPARSARSAVSSADATGSSTVISTHPVVMTLRSCTNDSDCSSPPAASPVAWSSAWPGTGATSPLGMSTFGAVDPPAPIEHPARRRAVTAAAAAAATSRRACTGFMCSGYCRARTRCLGPRWESSHDRVALSRDPGRGRCVHRSRASRSRRCRRRRVRSRRRRGSRGCGPVTMPWG